MDKTKQYSASTHLSYSSFKILMEGLGNALSSNEIKLLRPLIKTTLARGGYEADKEIGSSVSLVVNMTRIVIEEIGLKSPSILAILLYRPVIHKVISIEQVGTTFSKDIADIIRGLIKVNELDAKQPSLASENYINLLLSFAEDMRVILIKIANRLCLMRQAAAYTNDYRLRLAMEVSYLYTPLAHKLGLYSIKTELEDLYLKYTDEASYLFISQKITESKAARDRYVAEFIRPIEQQLQEIGLKYEIKGRVKSIASIHNKLKKQKIEFESIYDIFAVRIVLDPPMEKEKSECWHAYSIVADLYPPNPKRLKDWLSIPKDNGYESLHTTVLGPNSHWVEVQIRTHRMDEIAEKGLAAHWKYKGINSQAKMDDWLANLREVLENKGLDITEKLENFKLDLYDKEIYVFTPNGDLHKLPEGATILDFAFSIHTNVGQRCVSGKIKGRNYSIRHKLTSGDQIEIITSPNQTPKQDWLNVVVTSKAKNKIRQSIKEEANKQVDFAKELLKRRFKNRKIEENEGVMMRCIKKMGFKTVTDFYIKIASDTLDINTVIEHYLEQEKKEAEVHDKYEVTSADKYIVTTLEPEKETSKKEELLIGKDLTGIDYQLAKCCNPIYGDDIFGFVSSSGIKIHRSNCPNAHNMVSRFGYRIIPSRWSGKSESNYTIILRVIANDDIGIVNNLTSIIAKELGVNMRSINIDSNDGLFQGNIAVTISNKDILNNLMKKLRTVKGVKEVTRLN